jgi:dipeptidyl aminopeptidase/acylaminoacyl peptidase
MTRHLIVLPCCLAAALALVPGARGDTPLPDNGAPKVWSSSIQDFFRRSKIADAGLSPSGKVLAAIVPGPEGRGMLVAMDVKQRAPWPVLGFNDIDITAFAWVNDRRLIVLAQDLKNRLPGRAAFRVGRGDQPRWGNPFEGLLYAVNADGSHLTTLPLGGTPRGSYGDDSDDELMLTWNYIGTDASRFNVDAYRLNTTLNWNRQLTLMANVPHDAPSVVSGVPREATHLVFDGHFRVRALTVVSKDEKREAVWYRKSEDAPWTVLADVDIQHPGFWPAGFSADDKTLYVVVPENEDTLALYSYDTEGRHLGEKLIGVKGFDVQPSLIWSSRDKVPVGVRIWADKPLVAWFDPDFDRAQKSVNAALPDTINELSCGEDPDSPFLVFAHSDVQPGRYYLFDRKTAQLEEAFGTRPWIDPARMSVMRPIRYPARDGLTLRSYLTLPKGRPERGLPLVVRVHDGPYERDYWGFDPEVQFLASLGYAVLQPNFRGSQGYGLKFFKAGWHGWGLAMQDDVTDGIEYLVAQGTIDRRRVCILGGGYGGYAALMGLAREPGLFRCGIDRGGWTDLGRLFHADRYNFFAPMGHQWGIHELVGDPDTMGGQLARTSPLQLVDRIKAPVLMVYGENDVLVPIQDGASMRDALEHHHVAVQWITMDSESHFLRMEESRYRYYDAVEQFLRKYNPPD